MGMSINTNLMSLEAQRNLNNSQNALSTAMQRLSSGLRVNSSKDDAAGLAIAERMNSQVRGGNVAIRNANDGISLAQTADSALASVGNDLQRMRELAVQARNSTNTTADKISLDQEFQQLTAEVKRVLNGTTFNGKSILGADAGTLTFQIGPNTTVDDTIAVSTNNMTTNPSLTAVTGTSSTTVEAAMDPTIPNQVARYLAAVSTANAVSLTAPAGSSSTATGTAASNATGIALIIDNIDAALTTINDTRATFGATQNRFDQVIANLQSSVENQSAARSRIMDADFATETANLSRAQILQQAGNAMVAQANTQPQQVLKLLQGG